MKVRSLTAALGFAVAVSGCAAGGAPVGVAPDGAPIYGRSFTPSAGDGTVTLNCAVGENQRLADCRIVREQPEGRGYGQMALATVKPGTRVTGNATPGSRVDLTMRIRAD